jgi:Protein similar to CwfJ C-terminus 1/Protein similar to CwfJ C-terminus 2/RNA recognition motif. (a.k.a. RRM, RBD, or RNP domain)
MLRIKLLLIGSIGDDVDELISKLSSLQKSKAGPFDACFSVGKTNKSIIDHEMPIPLYLQDCSRLIGHATSDPDLPAGVLKLNKTVFLLQGSEQEHISNIWSLPIGNANVVVASLPPFFRLDSLASKLVQEKAAHASYVGCDLLLSSEFPQGIETLLPPGQAQQGSFDVSDIALKVKARYHVVPNTFFLQSPPFMHLPSSTSTFFPKHFGRFISLAPVASTQEVKVKGKLGKYIHALGLTPLHHMSSEELSSSQESIRSCPYTDETYQIQRKEVQGFQPTLGISEAKARRLMAETKDQHFGLAVKRNNHPSSENPDIDESSSTLFLHGLHNDVTGKLQQSVELVRQSLQKYGLSSITKPSPSSPFAFIDFESHAHAKKCLEETNGEISVNGTILSLRWGRGKTAKRARLSESDAMDSSSLYFRLPQAISSHQIPNACEQLRKAMEGILEQAIQDPDITAANEPALQVKSRVSDNNQICYGVLDFASHAAASMALASATGNIDGGQLMENPGDEIRFPLILAETRLYWAPERKEKDDQDVIETSSGIKFRRQHFPADSRTDCWFCLASPSCERHLVTNVYNLCYITMPKGPVHKDGHILIVPVAHTSRGALSDSALWSEVEDLKEKLRLHAENVWNMGLFVFERAIQTRGGYHTHVQCVPIPKHLGSKLEVTMISMAKSSGVNLKELLSDLTLNVLAEDEYFFAEIMTSNVSKRFLHNIKDGPSVPLQFGREVLAVVLDLPNVAHWKSSVLSTEEETECALKFRTSFSLYESSISKDVS